MSEPIAVYINGQCLTGETVQSAVLPLSDRGLLLGDGLFETLPVLGGHPLWWHEHRNRLLAGAEQIGLTLNVARLDEAVTLLAHHSERENAILRLTVTRGGGGRGLLPPETAEPTLFGTLSPLPQGLAFADTSLILSTIRRNKTSPTTSLKSLNYLDNIMATREAATRGADDALFLNTGGMVTSSTICNLFAIFGDKIVTPPVSDGLLPGIVRAQLLTLLPQWGFEAREESLTYAQLKKADGLFLTNSLRFIRAVKRLDDRIFEKSASTARLQTLMRDHISQITGMTQTTDMTL